MNTLVLAFLSISAAALMLAPRRWAALPLITAACYLSVTRTLEIGPFSFTVVRILIGVGIVRVILRGERLVGGINALDRWVILFCFWTCLSSIFREEPIGVLVFRSGVAYNAAGVYFLLRVFCTSIDDVMRLSRATAMLLLPVGLEMLWESTGSPSLFYLLEGTTPEVYTREGRIRAVGPFVSPITAGTIGAVSIPLLIGIWKEHRRTAAAGMIACLLIVFTSAASGPILSALAAVGAVALWPYRHLASALRWLALVAYLALALVMNAPVYYLMARIDLAGGSTGWHRARVIESAITYFHEWWLAGTEYTRHWAPTGGWSENHTDITSQYLYVGVLGGLPLMLLLIAVLIQAFSFVGQSTGERSTASRQNQFAMWTLGSALFGHAVTFVSVSYFDQSLVFLYLTLAAIGSAHSSLAPRPAVRSVALPHRARAFAGGHVARPAAKSASGVLLRGVARARPLRSASGHHLNHTKNL